MRRPTLLAAPFTSSSTAHQRYPVAGAFSRHRRSGGVAALLRSTGHVSLAGILTMLASPLLADIIPPKTYVTTPGGLNVADGSFVYSNTDLSIGTLSLERYHITGTRLPATSLIGKHMGHNFDIYVATNPKSGTSARPIVHIGSSASGVYAQTYSSGFIGPNNVDAYAGILTLSGSNYVYTDKDGNIYTFSSAIPRAGVSGASQRVTQINFADGRVQTFSYNASNQLKLVSDSSGYAIVFDYAATGGVSAACGFDTSQTYVTSASTCTGASLKVSYGYDGSGFLTSFQDVVGQTTLYTESTGGLGCVQPPGYATCKLSMLYSGAQVYQQTMADGSVWRVASSDPAIVDDPDAVSGDGAVEGQITDPDNKITSFAFTKSSPYNMTDANGYSTDYRFWGANQFDNTGQPIHDGTLLTEVDLPEGGQYLAEYGGPFNAISKETWVPKPGSGLPNRVRTLTYSTTGCSSPATYQNCAKPRAVTDYNANETDYTYYDFGGVQTEWSPAPMAGAARPLKIYTYSQLYAWVKNASGTLVQAATPVWKLTSEVQCQSAPGASSPVCDASSTQITTTYQYGAAGTADTLLLRGKVVDAGGLNLRTCYGYDAQGNEIWETKPRAGLATCS